MKTISITQGIGLAVLLCAGSTGCASHTQNSAGPATEKTPAQLGTEMEKSGTMTQSDYLRQNQLARTVSQTHTISDTDLTWILGELTAEKNSVARARAFNTLAAIRPMSAAQKAKILPAVAPYLSSADPLDQIGAQHAQKAAQAGG